MSDMIDIDDPDWVDKMIAVADAAPSSDSAHEMDGKLVISRANALCTARVSVNEVDGNRVVTLNFGWDSGKSRFWTCSVTHLEKYYRLM